MTTKRLFTRPGISASIDLKIRTPEAVKFLYICSFLHHKNIPETIFVNAAISAPDYEHSSTTLSQPDISWVQMFLRPFINPTPETSDAFHEIIGHLCAYSLVEVTMEQNFSFHRLVHDWGRRCALTAQLNPNCSALILSLSFSHFADPYGPETIAYTRTLLPHMQELQASLGKSLDAYIAFLFEAVYRAHGWWWHTDGAGSLAMEARKRTLGKKHPRTLNSMGRWMEAEKLELTELEKRKRVLGEEHSDTRLASTYRRQGRWMEAEGVEVMDTRTRALDEDHPDTLTRMANVPSTYRKHSLLIEAE